MRQATIFRLSLVFLTIFLKIAVLNSKPIEIIFKGDECPCAGREYKEGCEHGILQGYGLPSAARLGHQDCGQPRYKIRPQNAQVKYIYDYNVEVPAQNAKTEQPLTDLFARVDKILIETETAKTVNSDCKCNDNTPETSRVAPCPVHRGRASSCSTAQAGGYQVPVKYLRYDPTYIQLGEPFRRCYQRVKRDSSKRKTKKTVLKIRDSKDNFQSKHKLVKRDLDEIKSIATDRKMFSPDVLQYIPELLSPDYELGQCFSCCTTKKKNKQSASIQPLQILCEPSITPIVARSKGRNLKLVRLNEEDGEPVLQSSQYSDPYGQYISEVIYSHPDFIKSSDYGNGKLAAPVDVQEENAREYIQKLIEDQISNNEDDLHSHEADIYHRGHRSSELELMPINGQSSGDRDLVKVTPVVQNTDSAKKNHKNE